MSTYLYNTHSPSHSLSLIHTRQGEFIKVERDGESDTVAVTAFIPFSKRYLKYLTKKFLKKQKLRDYIRVIARQPHEYFLKYYTLGGNDQEE
jgi:large subunit ribosomal protein L22e